MTILFPTEVQFMRAHGADASMPEEILVALYPEFVVNPPFRKSLNNFQLLADNPQTQELAILLEFLVRSCQTEAEVLSFLGEAGVVCVNSWTFRQHALALFMNEDPEYTRFIKAFDKVPGRTFVSVLNGCMMMTENIVNIVDQTPTNSQQMLQTRMLIRGAFVALSIPKILTGELPYSEKRRASSVSVEESAVQFVEKLKTVLLQKVTMVEEKS